MTKMTCFMLIASAMVLASRPVEAGITLGAAADFSVLASSTVTNTGLTVIGGGDVGVSSGTSITGFGPGILEAPNTFHVADGLAIQANADLATAYNACLAIAPTANLTGQDLGGLTLTPGVYYFASAAQLTGTLTLNDLGDPNAQFIFQIGSTLTTASGSSVVTINGGSTPGSNVFWQVGSSATLGTSSSFEGNILAQTSITLTTGASIQGGSCLAMNGSVTLDTNQITGFSSPAVVPEPSTVSLVLVGVALMGFPACRRRANGRPSPG